MTIDTDTIEKARAIIAAASKPTTVVGPLGYATHEGVVQHLDAMLRAGEGPCYHVAIADPEDEKETLAVAITGNGPTSEANALYIHHSHDPIGGWAACLDEIERLQDEVRTVRRALSKMGDRPEGV